MNIRPKDTILFAYTGVKFSLNNLGGANWRQQVFNNYRLHLLDLLSKYGEADDYGEWLNEMQSRHANLYKSAGKNWENIAYKNDLVGQYLQDYRGGLGNNGLYKRFGSVQINPEDNYDFNKGITPNYNTRYNITNPPVRTSGDRTGYNYKVDNLYSAITDDRRLLGRYGDWDETSEDYKQWLKELNQRGWETFLDKDDYYKLRRIPSQESPLNLAEGVKPSTATEPDWNAKPLTVDPSKTGGSVLATPKLDKESPLTTLRAKLQSAAPGILEAVRLAGNLYNNERVFNEVMKGIRPNLLQSYLTHRQIVGDEATKLAYYRRAALGLTKAALPFTADADRLMAYMNEAKRIGDELRAQGDLADNQEIRRTSDESNAHEWANTQRNTEVANRNLIELNLANATKQQLKALKYTADWTNWDNYLMGIQAKAEQKIAKLKALLDLVDLLTMLDGIYDDEGYKIAYENLRALEKKHTNSLGVTDWNHPEILLALRALQKAKNLYLINYYRLKSAKSGTKLEYKDETAKYLYKTSKDIVEHFRKMSKMVDDSRIKSRTKPIRLSSHPKPRKMQQGGLAPFTIYRPLGVGGQSVASTQTIDSGSSKSSSSKDTAEKDKLDMIKELFKSLKGLPVDVSRVYQEIQGTLNRAKAYGLDLTTDDLASMYLSSMQKMAQLKYSEDAYSKAKELATLNEALNEIAVGTHGEMIFLDLKTGKVKFGTLSDMEDKNLNPLTNDLVLELRATMPNLAFNNDVLSIVNNGVGMNKISAQIKSMAASLGSSQQQLEGISEVESKKVKAGLQTLAGMDGTPDGFYKVTRDLKTSQANVAAALNYIYNMLPNNYKTLLEIHSNGKGKELIGYYLSSQTNDYYKENISPLTGKASDKTKSGGSSDELEMNNALRLLTGAGGSHLLTFGIGNNNVIQAYGRQATIADTTSNESAFGADFSYNEIYKSGVGRILDLDNASFGDVPINKAMKDSIIVDNSKIVGIDLPYRTTQDGRIVPDFAMLKKVEEADLEVLNQNLDPKKESDINKINQIYASKGLPIKYGGPTQLTGKYMRFAVIQATASEDAFLSKDGLSSNGTLTLVTDDNEIEKYIRLMLEITKDKKYSLDKPGILSWGNKDVYKGSIFIPITGDITDAALSGGGSKIKTGMTLDYDTMNRTWYTRNYVAPLEENFNK